MATSIETVTLGGVKVPLIYELDNRLPIVSMQVVFENSGHVEDGNISGLARMSSKLLNEGTKKLGSSAFAQQLEQKAIHLSVHTGTETMVIELSMLKEQMSEGVKMLAMLLQDPNDTPKILEKIRTTTIGNLKRKANDYDYVAASELRRLQFENSALQYPADGTLESIEKITLDDVKKFLKTRLVKQRVIMVIGGDVTLEEAKGALKEVVSVLPDGEKRTLQHIKVLDKARESVLKRPSEQAYVYFGSPYNMSVNDPDEYKARVATYILGTGGFGSRLMEEIRVKRGLAYSAYARVSISASHSLFSGYLQTKNESLKEAQQTVKEVIATFVKNGVTQEELDQAKKFLTGSEPLRVETLSQRLSRTFMEYYKGQSVGSAQKELDEINALTLNNLNTFIKKHDEILELSFAIVTQ
jgi:zinc protease